jgi:hypothetical protein
VPEITLLDVADPPELWAGLGFALVDGCCWVSDICLRLGTGGAGVVGWQLTDAVGLAELPVASGPVPAPPTPIVHPNGVVGLDHLVIATPDLPRTIAALTAHGLPLRRTREAGTPEQPFTQAFFRTERTILEVVGSEPAQAGSARFWGLAFTVADLNATVEYLGDRIRPAKQAVQAGRRIASLDRATGSTVPIAFMSERPAASARPAD